MSIDTLTSRLAFAYAGAARHRRGRAALRGTAVPHPTDICDLRGPKSLGHKLGGATGLPSYAMTLAVLTSVTTMFVSTVAMLMKHCIPAGERQ
ncbi:MAG: hypothetical protein IPQ15_09685 [Betaproteobacteria bacterium]|nr:hypothetical protein [Betaproteobacteria bacterium]